MQNNAQKLTSFKKRVNINHLCKHPRCAMILHKFPLPTHCVTYVLNSQQRLGKSNGEDMFLLNVPTCPFHTSYISLMIDLSVYICIIYGMQSLLLLGL